MPCLVVVVEFPAAVRLPQQCLVLYLEGNVLKFLLLHTSSNFITNAACSLERAKNKGGPGGYQLVTCHPGNAAMRAISVLGVGDAFLHGWREGQGGRQHS